MKAKTYRIKAGTTAEDLKNISGVRDNFFGIIKEDCDLLVSRDFEMPEHDFEFSVGIAFNSKNPEDWNDLDNVEVLDEDFLQPYSPFYAGQYYKRNVENFPCLEYCVEKYNEFMDSVPVLEPVQNSDALPKYSETDAGTEGAPARWNCLTLPNVSPGRFYVCPECGSVSALKLERCPDCKAKMAVEVQR